MNQIHKDKSFHQEEHYADHTYFSKHIKKGVVDIGPSGKCTAEGDNVTGSHKFDHSMKMTAPFA